jgi:Skp family chaperone for outer membrane proteins
MSIDHLDTKLLRIVQEDTLKELEAQQNNVKDLQSKLTSINAKLQKKEKLSDEDVQFMGNLGWLSTLSVAIAAAAASL